MKIWIYGLNGRHYEDEKSDIAIYKSLKLSEQNIEAPISGFLQIFKIVTNQFESIYFSLAFLLSLGKVQHPLQT